MTNFDSNMLILKKLNNPTLMKTATSLPKNGILKEENNYTFLQLSENYITQLFPLLENHSTLQRPAYPAHITVFYPEEQQNVSSEEINKVHYFEVTGLCYARLISKEYYILMVKSPSLISLRAKHQLPKQLCFKEQSIDLHITIATTSLK